MHGLIVIYTALVSVATAEVTNIMENVTTISMIRAWTGQFLATSSTLRAMLDFRWGGEGQ